MRVYYIILFVFFICALSCKDNRKELEESQLRAQQHVDSVFTLLEKNWNFRVPVIPASVEEEIEDWKQWADFAEEIKLKPVASVGAFQKKIEKLNSTSNVLRIDIPEKFNKPEIRSRITVINNTFNNLDMYLNVKPIPIEKIEELLPQVNKQLISLIDKMEELKIKSVIPKEIGEEDMLRALDTIRHANPELIK